MYTRRKINPVLRVVMIVAAIVVAVVLIGRLDFFGWVLRGFNELVPSKPPPQYSEEQATDFKAQIGDLEAENAILREMVDDLRNRLNISANEAYSSFSVIEAEVIWRDHARLYKTAIINRGQADGVEVGMPVVDANGLVGRIVQARGAISRIELITSPDCSFGIVDQRSRAPGIVRGSETVKWQREDGMGFDDQAVPPNILELEYLSPSADIQTDDVLVTNGLSGITPGGIRVGQVDQIISMQEKDWYEIRVLPFADIDHLETVAVIIYSEKELAGTEDILNETGEIPETPETVQPGN